MNQSNEERWIECEQVYSSYDSLEENESLPTSIFVEPDLNETFSFSLVQSNHDKCYHFHRHSSITTIVDNDCNKMRKIEISGIKAEYGQIINSTGCTLWRASTLLCNFLCTHYKKFVEHKSIVELGAGLGLCGITCYLMGGSKRTIMTDGDTDALNRLRQNAKTNVAHEHWDTLLPCRQMRWGHVQQIQEFKDVWGTFDVVIGSDIIYLEECLDPLFQTVVELLSPPTAKLETSNAPSHQDALEILSHQPVFLLAYARRNVKIDLVLECAIRHGLQCLEPNTDEGIYIFYRVYC